MANLTTRYLGLELDHPFVAGASPLSRTLDKVKELEDEGAAVIVLPSFFEEQTRQPGEADKYLEHARSCAAACDIPIIGSLNGVTPLGWIAYARQLEQTGVAAIELNVYHLPCNPAQTGTEVERMVEGAVRAVTGCIDLPVAVKLSPFFSALPNIASRLTDAGAAGLVLFNRFYQPDIDPETGKSIAKIKLSDPTDLPLRLRWVAILHGQIEADLALTGGVHQVTDAVKAVMAGASAVQMVSALMNNGPKRLTSIRDEFSNWMDERGHETVEQLRGIASHAQSDDPTALERANYLKIIGPK